MSTLVGSVSELEWRCREYREINHLPAVVDPVSKCILLHVGAAYGAVTMPVELGERVQQRLRATGIEGPVVAHPRAHSWTFLTGPSRYDHPTIRSAEMFRRYITVAGAGSQIVLPSPHDENTGYRIWVQAPQGAAKRPPQSAVLEAALTPEVGRITPR